MLVGSVAGQRYWSSMLSLDARITCGCWTPDDNQVYLGTASAQLVVMDVHGAMVSQVRIDLYCACLNIMETKRHNLRDEDVCQEKCMVFDEVYEWDRSVDSARSGPIKL